MKCGLRELSRFRGWSGYLTSVKGSTGDKDYMRMRRQA